MQSVPREVFGLFVDDGSFALSILAWLALASLAAFGHFAFMKQWGGFALFLGLGLILLESALRYARRKPPLK